MEWHSRLLLLTSAVFTTLVQWIGALQKTHPVLGPGLQSPRSKVQRHSKESPGMMAGRTTGSATETHVSTQACLPPQVQLRVQGGSKSELTAPELTAVQSQFHRCLKSVLHNEGWSTVITFEHCLPLSLQRRPDGGSEENYGKERNNKKVWHLKITPSIIIVVRRPT